jgi:O-antigen/teichoic acid export membrane protein
MPREEVSFARGVVGGAFLSLQPLVLNALSVPVMAYTVRRLGPVGYGQWAIATSLVGACMLLANLGLRGTFVRAVAVRSVPIARAAGEQLALRLLLCLAAATVALLAGWQMGYPPVVLHCTAVAAVAAILATIAAVACDLLQGLQRLPTVALVNLIAGSTLTVAAAVTVWLAPGPVALSLAYLTGPAVAALGMWAGVRRAGIRPRPAGTLRRFRALLAEAGPFAAQHLSGAAGTYALALLLPRLVGAGGFGIFTAGNLIGSRLAALPDGLCTAAYPAITTAFHDAPRRGALIMLRYAAVILLVAVAAAAVATACAETVGRILFPDDWAACAAVITITVWAVPLAGLDAVMGYALNAAGKESYQARASLAAGACTLPLSVVLLTKFGLTGACWAALLPPAIRMIFLLPCFLRTFAAPLMKPINVLPVAGPMIRTVRRQRGLPPSPPTSPDDPSARLRAA